MFGLDGDPDSGIEPKQELLLFCLVAEESGRCIDLDWMWENQRIPPALNEALKIACEAAHEHITTQDGNPGEVSKRESCWNEFRGKKLSEPDAWRDELSETAFTVANTQEESLAPEWERVRHEFAGDSRTIGELEALTGKVWMRTRRGDPIYFYAEKTWEQLRAEKLRGNQRLGITSLRGLVELVSAAAS